MKLERPPDSRGLYKRVLAIKPGYLDFQLAMARAEAAAERFADAIRVRDDPRRYPHEYMALLGGAEVRLGGGIQAPTEFY